MSLATSSPGCPELPGSPRSKPLRPLHSWPSLGQTQALQGGLRSNPSGRHTGSGGDKSTAEDQLNPGAEQPRRGQKTSPAAVPAALSPHGQRGGLYACQIPAALSPHGQRGGLYACQILRRAMRVPTKENSVALAAKDTAGENTPEQD